MPRQNMSGARDSKAQAKRGASLVVVVCVSAFLVAFALAMVHTAGLMLSQANQRLKQERSRQLARSFSQVLYEELQKGGSPEDPGAADSFYGFACKFLEDSHYLNYDPDQPDATIYHYQVDTPTTGDAYGTVTVALYKESEDDTELSGTIINGGSSGSVDPLVAVAGSVQRATLTVEVTARADGMSYSYSTVYEQSIHYKDQAVRFTYEGREIRWDKAGQEWKENTPSGDTVIVTPGDAISFVVTPGLENIEECQYNKAIREEGDPEGSETPGGGGGGTP